MYSYRTPKDPHRRQTLDYRFQLTRDLLINLHRGECCSVVGVGSSGKSRLLQHITRTETLEYHLGDGAYDHFIALVECNAWLDNTAWAAYESIARAVNTLLDNVDHPVLRSLGKDLRPMYDAVTSEKDLAFKHIITGIGYMLRNRNIRLTLCFDEFDSVMQDFDAQLFRNLRALRNQNKYQLTYLVATRKQMPFQRKPEYRAEIEEFYELFSDHTFAIGPYDAKDAGQHVADLEKRYEYKLKKVTRDMLIDISGGHPGLIGASFKLLESGKQEPTTPEAMGRLLLHDPLLWKECRKIWESLRDDERLALRRLAVSGRPAREDANVLGELTSKGLVRTIGDRGATAVFSPIFHEFARSDETKP
jgi:hypothetical protein